ncbi:hypothetical protein GCK32_012722, partial [Trichostrongylus colubriformis]
NVFVKRARAQNVPKSLKKRHRRENHIEYGKRILNQRIRK